MLSRYGALGYCCHDYRYAPWFQRVVGRGMMECKEEVSRSTPVGVDRLFRVLSLSEDH